MKKIYQKAFAALFAAMCAMPAHAAYDVVLDTPGLYIMETGSSPRWASPNGQWLWYSDQGVVTIMDIESGQEWEYGDYYVEQYHVAHINSKGLAGGRYKNQAAIWTANDGWQLLPGSEDGMGKATSVYYISEDGNLIVGRQENAAVIGAGVNFAEMAQREPVVWERNEDGSWKNYYRLPANNADFSGRTPQAFDGLFISDDNQTIGGRFIDHSGYYSLPIVYKRNADNKWDLIVFGEDWQYNQEAAKPEYPRQEVPEEPDVTKHMTAEEQVAYNQDLTEYNDSIEAYRKGNFMDPEHPNPTYNPKNHYQDYFDTETTDGISRWNAYVAEYDSYRAEVEAYNEALDKFDTDMAAYIRQDRKFSLTALNYIKFSDNGKYLAPYTAMLKEGATSVVDIYAQPSIFNMETADFRFPLLDEVGVDYRPNAILNDGTLIFQMNGDYQVSVLLQGATEPIALEEYIKSKSEKAFQDLSNLIVQNTETYNFGYVSCDGDFKIIHSWVMDVFRGCYIYWRLDMTHYQGTAIDNVEKESIGKLTVQNGILSISGIENGEVAIYDLTGKRIFSSGFDNAEIGLDGIANGLYIVQVESGDNVFSSKVYVE